MPSQIDFLQFCPPAARLSRFSWSMLHFRRVFSKEIFTSIDFSGTGFRVAIEYLHKTMPFSSIQTICPAKRSLYSAKCASLVTNISYSRLKMLDQQPDRPNSQDFGRKMSMEIRQGFFSCFLYILQVSHL